MTTISPNHQGLFRKPTTEDKLTFFNSLLNSNELDNNDLTLALLKIIHGELKDSHRQEHSMYKKYARAIESLRHQKFSTLQQVVDAWRKAQPAFNMPEDWWDSDNE
jgi:hypothetical protein